MNNDEKSNDEFEDDVPQTVSCSKFSTNGLFFLNKEWKEKIDYSADYIYIKIHYDNNHNSLSLLDLNTKKMDYYYSCIDNGFDPDIKRMLMVTDIDTSIETSNISVPKFNSNVHPHPICNEQSFVQIMHDSKLQGSQVLFSAFQKFDDFMIDEINVKKNKNKLLFDSNYSWNDYTYIPLIKTQHDGKNTVELQLATTVLHDRCYVDAYFEDSDDPISCTILDIEYYLKHWTRVKIAMYIDEIWMNRQNNTCGASIKIIQINFESEHAPNYLTHDSIDYSSYSKGLTNYLDGNYEEAIDIFTETIKLNCMNTRYALYHLACIYENKGDYNKAIKFYSKSIKKGSILAIIKFAHILHSNKKYTHAKTFFALANENGYDIVPYINTLFKPLNKNSVVLQEYLLAVAETGNNNAMAELGNIYFNLDEYEKAKQCYLKLIKAGYKHFYVILARICYHTKKQKQMKKYYLLAHENGNNNALIELGNMWKKQNKYKKAENYYLLAYENGINKALNPLINILYKTQQIDTAEYFCLIAIKKGIYNVNTFLQNESDYFHYTLKRYNASDNIIGEILNWVYKECDCTVPQRPPVIYSIGEDLCHDNIDRLRSIINNFNNLNFRNMMLEHLMSQL